MSELLIRINLDNAAFENGPKTEIRRILKNVSDNLGNHEKKLKDINGNTVGFFHFIESKEPNIEELIKFVRYRKGKVTEITRDEQDILIYILKCLSSYKLED
jgi:hypothetical protein